MFTSAGNVSLIIGEIKFAEPKFPQGKGPADFDICVEVTHAEDQAQHDWVRLEWSDNYGKGNFATMTQKEITVRTLRQVGFEGDDLTTIGDQLTGKTAPGFVKESKPNAEGKTYMNVYLGGGGGNAPKEDEVLSADEIKRRLTGGGATAKAAPTATAKAAPAFPAASGKNPFA